MEPPFPIQPTERANENRKITVVLSYGKEQAASALMRLKRITKENGSILHG